MPDTWPRIQRFGSGLGHDASTWNCGTLRSCAWVCFETGRSTAAEMSTADPIFFTVTKNMVPPFAAEDTRKLTRAFPRQGIVLASPSAAVHLHPNPRGTEDEPETHQRSSYRGHGRFWNSGLGARRGRRGGRRQCGREQRQLGLELLRR